MSVEKPAIPAGGNYSEIMMDDAAGSQQVAFRAEKDMAVVVKNEKTETIGQNETHSVGADMKRTVHGNQTVTIGNNDALTIGKAYDVKVAKDRSLKVGASESVSIGSGSKAAIGKEDSEKVGSVRVSIVGSVKVPDFKAMARSAAAGLVPQQLKGLAGGAGQGGGGASAFSGVLRGAGTAAANAYTSTLVQSGGSTSAAGQAASQSLGGSAAGALGVSGGQGGFPTAQSLQNQYTQQFSAANVQTQFRGAVSSATGGLSDLVWNDKSSPRPNKVEFGLDAADKLVGLFCVGGITRSALKKLSKMVGGAYVQAALGPIEWGSAGALTETIGGLKLTATPKDIGQEVTGKMILTVGAQILRAAQTIMIKAKRSTVKVIGPASYSGVKVVFSGGGGVTITAGEVMAGAGSGKDGAPPPSHIKLSKGGAVIKTPMLGLEGKKVVLAGGGGLSVAKP